jgi:hypothetical protein
VARTAAAKGSLLFETLPISVVLAAIAQTCRPPHSLWGGQNVEPRTLSLC